MIGSTTAASRGLRSRRDALIGALGFGDPYPLRDLPVTVEPKIAPFGSVARVLVDDAQPGVFYSLRNVNGAPLAGAPEPAEGTGNGIVLNTPKILEDVEYGIWAERRWWIWPERGADAPTPVGVMLLATAEVKVGLDADLTVRLESDLDPPNLVDFASSVTVAVDGSQEGVEYRLVHFPNGMPDPTDFSKVARDFALSDPVQGTGSVIRIASIPLSEDSVIRVRAVKHFEESEDRRPQTTVLNAEVPFFVRANRDLAPVGAPAVVPYGGDTEVAIVGAQASAHYTFWRRPVTDREYVRHAGRGTLTIDGPDEPIFVRIPIPETPADEPGYLQFGDAGRGQDGRAKVVLSGVEEDAAVLVRATKQHTRELQSSVWLRTAAAIVAYPDTKPVLRLEFGIGRDAQPYAVRLAGGQPGVFYEADKAFPPLYVHKVNAAEPSFNKGIGELEVAIDFVMANGPGEKGDTMHAPPATAFAGIDEFPLPATLVVRTTKAQTGLHTDLAEKVNVPAAPETAVDPESVTAGGDLTVTVQGAVGEQYAVLADGQPVSTKASGRGKVVLKATAVPPGSDVELQIVQAASAEGVTVERRLRLGAVD